MRRFSVKERQRPLQHSSSYCRYSVLNVWKVFTKLFFETDRLLLVTKLVTARSKHYIVDTFGTVAYIDGSHWECIDAEILIGPQRLQPYLHHSHSLIHLRYRERWQRCMVNRALVWCCKAWYMWALVKGITVVILSCGNSYPS